SWYNPPDYGPLRFGMEAFPFLPRIQGLMVTTFCLLTCALTTAQPTDGTEWLLLPRLTKGHELVYHGSIVEETYGKGVQFSRTYRLESRAFVLDSSSRGLDV